MGLGAEAVGHVIFTNLFALKQEFLEMFSFAQIPDFETTTEYKDHIKVVVNTVNKAVENLNNLPNLMPILKGIGIDHIDRGVQKEDYDVLGQAVIMSLQQALGEKFTFELKRAWLLVYTALKNGIISDNYEEQDKVISLYHKVNIEKFEIDNVVKWWRKAVHIGQSLLGSKILRNIFVICPELYDLFPTMTPDQPEKLEQQFLLYGQQFVKEGTECIASL